jgi:hypothetical protein
MTDIAPSTVGAVAELRVSCDLMARGYAVFRALSPACFCDLVVYVGELAFRVEVRYGTVGAGKVWHGWNSKDRGRSDVLAIVTIEGVIYRAVSDHGNAAPFVGGQR